jgi:hypothetical protein
MDNKRVETRTRRQASELNINYFKTLNLITLLIYDSWERGNVKRVWYLTPSP